MKLIQHGLLNQEKAGIIDKAGERLDVSQFIPSYNAYFFENDGIERLKKWLTKNEKGCPRLNENTRLGAPIDIPSKIICVGMNYAKHAAESGSPTPNEPVLFFKATSAICGPFDEVQLPKGSEKTDWEVELAVVIGKRASYISEAAAMEYVAGYMIHNDYSERSFQLERGGQWVKGKSCDTFAPLGPFLATKDEIKDSSNLNLWLKVNDETMQSSNTGDLVFNVSYLVHYISQFMTLLPGDIISTGTPAGVGLGLKPPRYLKAGDVVELGIDGLGIARQHIVAFRKN